MTEEDWLRRLGEPGGAEPEQVRRDLEWLAGPDRWLVTREDPRYPAQLAAVPKMPEAFFVEGDPAKLSLPQVAIVGSRSATLAGRETAADFARRARRGRRDDRRLRHGARPHVPGGAPR